MRILISNDDGIHAGGLKALLESLQDLGEIFVVAPDRERSATGHGITVDRPLRITPICLPVPVSRAWAVDGTPADCVKLAVEDLLPEPPHLVIAGINQGPNLGTDVLYSGTVSAAIEGVINGFPSLAVSLATYDQMDFSPAGQFIREIVPAIKDNLPPDILLNINVPAGRSKGRRITCLGNRRYINIFHKRTDPRGRVYYWMAGEPMDLDDKEPGNTDVEAVRNQYISITPIQLDLTNYRAMHGVENWLSALTQAEK